MPKSLFTQALEEAELTTEQQRLMHMAASTSAVGVSFLIGTVAYIEGAFAACLVSSIIVLINGGRSWWLLIRPRPGDRDIGETQAQFSRRMKKLWVKWMIVLTVILIVLLYLRFFL